MLHLLREYAFTHGLQPEPGFAAKDIRWCLNFDPDGNFLGAVELGDVSSKRNRGRTFTRCPEFTFSELKAGSETRAHFLWEAAQVVALLNTDEKAAKKHEYFVGLLREASDAMPELAAVAEQLERLDKLEGIQANLTKQKVKLTDKITLRIGGQFLLESDRWHDWWRQKRLGIVPERVARKSQAAGDQDIRVRCFASGELAVPARVQGKILGLAGVGGQSSGDALVSFKQESFCSFGLQQAHNAAISEQAEAEYRAALNDLVKNHGATIAGVKVTHWFKEQVPPEDDPLPWLHIGQDEQRELHAQRRAAELLQAIREGKRPDLRGNVYYALTLSGAAGRVMVRDWMEGQFEELVTHVDAWFDDLAVVHREGGKLAPPPKFLAVLGATVRELNDLEAPVVSKMWQVAVRGLPIPQTALAQAIARARVDIIEDTPPNHARMGLIKAYHVRQERSKGDPSMTQPYLNEDHPQPAYHCGRLMAVLAALQRRALGDVGAGVVQRYYAAASSTPALVLGRLIRTGQFHLGKLEPGLAHWYEDKLAGIWCRIKDGAPRTLDLEEQSLFALGYYQQLADLRTKKSDSSTGKTEESHA